MYEDQTADVVLERMLANTTGDIDEREGSVLRDLLALSSIEFGRAYSELSKMASLFFSLSDDMPRELLEEKVALLDIYPKEAVAASGVLTITGPSNTLIVSGTRVSTLDETPIYYKTTETVTIPESGVVSVLIVAEVAGVSGNASANSITRLVETLEGVSVTNESEFVDGLDIESNASLYTRYMEKKTQTSSSGNRSDYIRWSKEVKGIGYARVFRLWNGPGTVRVVLLTDDKKSPSEALVQLVRDNIALKMPDVATVTVDAAKELSLDIDVKLTINENSTNEIAAEQFRQELDSYFTDIAFNDEVVRYAKIGECLLNAKDVIDYENLYVNNGSGNIRLEQDQIPVLGKINILE